MSQTSPTIMVVDDDPIGREIAAATLADELGCEVVQAENGSKALAQLHAHGHHLRLILLDLNMPDFDGIEFIQAMGGTYKHVALLIISGAPRPILKAAERLCLALEVPLLGVLAKPVKPAELTQIAKAITGNSPTRGDLVA